MPEASVARLEPPAEAEAPAKTTDIVIELTKPVQAHGELLKKMKFREPTGADMMQFGERWPVQIDWTSGQVTPNPAVMSAVMSTLAAVPPSTIKMMSGKDFTTCAFALQSFFVPGAQAMQF
jgi:hypothetical protein